MPKIVLSLDGVVIRETQLTKERTTLGRRPYNDIVVDNLAVSGEHAAFLLVGPDVYLEDLDSTNGTYVNGRAIKKQQLYHADIVEIGKYQIRFIHEAAGSGNSRAMPIHADSHSAPLLDSAPHGASAAIKVLSGAAAGRELPLTKPLTTVGLPGIAVAAITQRNNVYVLAHVEGGNPPTVNGTPLGSQPLTLHSGDVISIAGNDMRFEQR
ncbi:MAG: FHA domain-containing protein [Burkholderiales bacterium]